MAKFPFDAYLALPSTPITKGSPEDLARRYFAGRKNLLTVVILSSINLLTLLLNADFYFPFSASIPYFAPVFGMVMDEGLMIGSFFTIIGYGFSVAFILFYLISWLLSKERSGWMVAALVVFILDCVIMLYLTISVELLANMIPDILFHALILYFFISSVISAAKLKRLAKEAPPQEETLAPEFYE